jgi:cytochrome c peroxidase
VTPTTDYLRRRSFLFTRVPSNLTETEINALVAFLETLTDPAAVNRRNEVPQAVPSGLPVDR